MRFRLVVAFLLAIEVGEASQRAGNVRMVLAEGLLADGERALVARLSLVIAVLRVVEPGQVV